MIKTEIVEIVIPGYFKKTYKPVSSKILSVKVLVVLFGLSVENIKHSLLPSLCLAHFSFLAVISGIILKYK